MNLNLLQEILEVCIIPLLGVLTAYLVNYIKAKSTELNDKVDNDMADKYIKMLTQTITDCVIATNQTYVESLKREGKFDAEAQKQAFEDTKTAVLSMLNVELQDFITEVFGDVNEYLTTAIEASVNNNKANS